MDYMSLCPSSLLCVGMTGESNRDKLTANIHLKN